MSPLVRHVSLFVLVTSLVAVPGAVGWDTMRLREPRRMQRQPPDGSGPHLFAFPAPRGALGKTVVESDGHALNAGGSVFVDVPCNVFLPGKADPSEWMSTSTFARVTYDGVNYVYGYDPMAQSYDAMVSALADYPGILVQETVGVIAAQVPGEITAQNARGIELRFVVEEHNLFPFETIAITALEDDYPPSSSLNSIEAQLLYEDARGFTGNYYFLDHVDAGGHAIDLGQQAVQDMATRLQSGDGWYGVGLAAGGWDLSGSFGETVFWTMAGGGTLNTGAHPFFRVYYNAPPDAFALVQPADGAVVPADLPVFEWEAANDPNGDTPITYVLRMATDPQMEAAIEIDAGTSLSASPPIELQPDLYYWEVVAQDPDGAARVSERRAVVLVQPTDVPRLPLRFHALAAPNPFNPNTTIRFELPEPSRVDLSIYDVHGRRLRALVARRSYPRGTHQIDWDGRDDAGRPLAAGTYYAVLRTPTRSATHKLSLVN